LNGNKVAGGVRGAASTAFVAEPAADAVPAPTAVPILRLLII